MADTKTPSKSGNEPGRDKDGRFAETDAKSSGKAPSGKSSSGKASGAPDAPHPKAKGADRSASGGKSDDPRSKSR